MLCTLALSSAMLGLFMWPSHASQVWRVLADWPTLLLSQVLAVDLAGLAILAYRVRHRVPLRSAIAVLRSTLLAPERLAGLAITAFAVRWTMLQAVAWKSSIPVLHPFAFDRQLAAFGAAFTGRHPWEWFAPLVHSSFWLGLIDLGYVAWLPTYVIAMLVAAWAPYSAERRRFLFAITLLWVAGSWLGVLVSSAGPVYYHRVTGLASSFDSLTTLVHTHAPRANLLQSALWDAYRGAGSPLIAGISAFPSLHVAVPALFVFAAPTRFRWWAICLTGWTWLGSIVLGWHYLADGMGGILLALTCWWLAGCVSRLS